MYYKVGEKNANLKYSPSIFWLFPYTLCITFLESILKGHLYFIMGVTGSGKGTLRGNLAKQDIKNLEFLKSYVTREMRPGEKNGDTYWFVSLEEFENGIKAGDFLEYEVNHKVAYYGTKNKDIQDGLTSGKIIMKEIDTKGLKQVVETYPEMRQSFTSFFLNVPDEIIRKRFYERNPDGKISDIENRIESTIFEREQAEKYCDHIIDASQSPEKVLQSVLHIMNIS